MSHRFNVLVDRIDKKPVPLLVVGLGGTGIDTLLTIKKTFAERFNLPKDSEGRGLPAPARTAYLGFNTRFQPPDGMETDEYVSIHLPNIDRIIWNKNDLLTDYERSWINQDLQPTFGFHKTRQEARLALSRNYEKVSQAIRCALSKIVPFQNEENGIRIDSIEIVIVTSIGGGTGSGIFLDMCQILRNTVQSITSIPATLTGYIVMPDVSLANVTIFSGMENSIRCNAYAALKELDFWMRIREHHIPYTMRYGIGSSISIEWKDPPFDCCILMSSSNVEGIPYKDGYMTVRNTIAENLMHYMAWDDNDYSSPRRLENTLTAISIRKPYPLFYGYRAVGAYTARIPKQAILFYESSLLFHTFIPKRNADGDLQPDRRLFTDGQGKVRAENIIGNGKQLMQDFRANICPLPIFCRLDLNDDVKVASVQHMVPPPHNKWQNWRDSVSTPAALKASEEYLNKAWKRFSDFAYSVITDPEQGPFALEAYLDSPEGLLSDINEILESWIGQHAKIRDLSIPLSEEMCEAYWSSFRNPPVLGKQEALEQYDHAIKTLYTYVNNCEFLKQHVAALDKLILRINQHLRDGLKPLCNLILLLEEEFGKQHQPDTMLVQDIDSLSTVQKRIDEAFKDANADGRMSARFLGRICETSLRTLPNEITMNSRIEFISRMVSFQDICRELEAELEEVYGSVNNRSLDDIMVANVGEDVSAQQRWMNDFAISALNSALPMFMQDSAFKSAVKSSYCHMWIPQNAPKHMKYIREAFKTYDPTVEPWTSCFEDHLYVMNIWEKLPLCRYGLFEDLRTAYDQALNASGSEGMHLVRNGSPNADYQSDWSQLPSPKPFFLFGRSSVASEMLQYEKVRKLVERGIKCGMIKMDTDVPFTRSTIHILYSEDQLHFLSQYDIRRDIDVISNAAAEASSITCEKLRTYLNSAKCIILEDQEIRPSAFAGVLGLEQEPCDPFDPSIAGNTSLLQKAKENYLHLCTLLTEVMIYRRPDLVRALEIQIPAREVIFNYILPPPAPPPWLRSPWPKRHEYAETASDMLIYLNDVIVIGADGYRYRNKGTRYNIITPALMSEDLKTMNNDLLKAICFLADAPDDNAAKADLTRMLQKAKIEFSESVNEGYITADDLRELEEAAKDIIQEMIELRESLKRDLHENPGKKDELNQQIKLTEEIMRILENRSRLFQKMKRI